MTPRPSSLSESNSMSVKAVTIAAVVALVALGGAEAANPGAKICKFFPSTPGCAQHPVVASPKVEKKVKKFTKDIKKKTKNTVKKVEKTEKGVFSRISSSICGTASFLPGCNKKETPAVSPLEEEQEQEENSMQAVNCLQFPNTPFCVEAMKAWSPEEKAQFWKLYNQNKAQEEEEEQSLIGGPINCQAYPNAPYCVKMRKQWAAEGISGPNDFVSGVFEEEQEEAMIGGPINCQAYPEAPYCVKMFKQWAVERAALEEAEEFTPRRMGMVNCKVYPGHTSCARYRQMIAEEEENSMQAVNCMEFPNTPFCVEAMKAWTPEEKAQFWKLYNQNKAQEEEQEEAMIGGPINCQAYPNAPYCVKMRKQWANEGISGPNDFVSGVFEEEGESLIGGPINCQAYPEAPYCVKMFKQWAVERAALEAAQEEQEEQRSMIGGPINCQAYPNAPYCVKMRQQWANEGFTINQNEVLSDEVLAQLY